jgi:hypothetical protein
MERRTRFCILFASALTAGAISLLPGWEAAVDHRVLARDLQSNGGGPSAASAISRAFAEIQRVYGFATCGRECNIQVRREVDMDMWYVRVVFLPESPGYGVSVEVFDNGDVDLISHF